MADGSTGSGAGGAPAGPGAGGDGMAGGKRTAWMSHVKKTMRANKGKSLKQVLKLAKKTYKKTRRGGGPDELMGGAYSPMPLDGGRRRSRKGKKGKKGKKGSRKH